MPNKFVNFFGKDTCDAGMKEVFAKMFKDQCSQKMSKEKLNKRAKFMEENSELLIQQQLRSMQKEHQ